MWVGGYVVEALYNLADAVSAHRAPAAPRWNDIPPFFLFFSLLLAAGGIEFWKAGIQGGER
ncbi:hypothetical protein PLACP1_25070 [Planifilum fimeticola]